MKKNIFVEDIEKGKVKLIVATDENPYLGSASVAWFKEAVDTIKKRDDINVVIVSGTSKRFCMGASRNALLSVDPSLGLSNYIEYFADIPRLLLSIPVPTIADMRGHGIGGGLILGLWCTGAFLSENSLYGANFMSLGFTPGMGATVVLEEAFGGPVARDLLLSGKIITGLELSKTAKQIEPYVAAKSQVEELVMETAEMWAAQNPTAIRLLTKTINERRLSLLETAVKKEIEMHEHLFETAGIRDEIAERYH